LRESEFLTNQILKDKNFKKNLRKVNFENKNSSFEETPLQIHLQPHVFAFALELMR
jgi:hypothetical protein